MQLQSRVPFEQLSQKGRIVELSINILLLWGIYIASTGSFFPTGNGSSIWLLAGLAYWLLVLVAAPFFSPPKDSLGTAISVILLLAPIDFSNVVSYQREIVALNTSTLILAIVVGAAALIAILLRDTKYDRINQVCYRISNALGKGEILFTLSLLISVLGFYQSQPGWIFAILSLWIFAVVGRPIEVLLRLAVYLGEYKNVSRPLAPAGLILRIDDPDVVRINLYRSADWKVDNVHIAYMPDGKMSYVLPLFIQVQNSEIIGTGLCCPIEEDINIPTGSSGTVYLQNEEGLAARLGGMLSGEAGATKIAGIVVEGSSIADIRFQVVRNIPFEEGMVVFSHIREKKVYYQILDARTNEENFQQNPYGVHIVHAAQLGIYDEERGFQKFPWLPNMNQPLFLVPPDEVVAQPLLPNEFFIGTVPCTSYGVPVILDDLIEYHTAILGMTGTGKTELALDVIKNALDRHAKVFCVDFTGEYKSRLVDYKPVSIGLTIAQGSELEQLLFAIETGAYGAPGEKAAFKKFLDAIKPQVAQQIDAFLTSGGQRLGIFELAEITNTKATLRTTELYLSAIMDWARNHRKAEKILIALEEAHTIIPEGFGSGFDSDTQWVVSRIGQIALQGRKYGVGLLIISQRTALVSKTILSQCNTYFTHCLVDKTSLDYLSSVYSAEHVKAIPNLRFLEFLAYGKAVKSERPLLVKRAFDQAKLDASRALDVTNIATVAVATAEGTS